MPIVRELLTKWGFKVDQGPLRQVEGSIQSIKSDLKNVGIIAGVTAGAIGFFAKKAGDIEQVEIAFETMTGSASKAQALIQDITKFAARTPFQLTGLIESSKKLLAFGIDSDQIVDKMTVLGNIAAGVGREKLPSLILAFGKIRTKGKATMEELNILLEAGVPVLDALAQKFGKNTKKIFKMVSAGKVGFNDVDEALRSLATGSGKFAGLMEKQSRSFLGIISNIFDFLEQLSIEIGKKLLPTLKPMAKQFLEFLTVNKEFIKSGAVDFFKTMVDVLLRLFFIAKDIFSVFKSVASAFGGVSALISTMIQGFLILVGARMLFSIGQMAEGIFGIVKALGDMKMATLKTNAAALLMPILIGAAIVGLLLVFEDILAFFQGRDSFTAQVVASANEILDEWDAAFTKMGDAAQIFFATLFTPLRAVMALFKGIAAIAGTMFGGGGILQALKEGGKVGLGTLLDTGSWRGILGLGNNPEGVFSNAFGTTPPAAGGARGANTNNVSVTAPINVTVPEGTPPELVGEKTKEGVREAMATSLRSTLLNVQSPVEF